MQDHAEVLTSLEKEFKRMDRMFTHGELRVFGKDTERVFKELDMIRRKQIDLAGDHIALEALNESPQHSSQASEDIEQSYQHSVETFSKKEASLKSLMLKLDDLGECMNRFREISEPEVHRNAALQPERLFVSDLNYNAAQTDESPLSTPRQEKLPHQV